MRPQPDPRPDPPGPAPVDPSPIRRGEGRHAASCLHGLAGTPDEVGQWVVLPRSFHILAHDLDRERLFAGVVRFTHSSFGQPRT